VNQVNNKLLTVIADDLSVDPSTLDINSGPEIDPPEWDSFAHVTLMLSIEKAYGVKFVTEEFTSLDSISKIQQYLSDEGVL